jgi:hypothetical protein
MRVDDPIDARNDVDILSASYDTASDSIEVCAVLCEDECMPRSQYRFHFDYDMNNGMASYLSPEDRDEGLCSISSIENFTGTTSDDTVRFVCGNDGMNYRKVTGPAEDCTPVNEDGEFCCTVALSSLIREDGSTLQECDAVDIWMDAQNKGKQDRAPDTDDSDGCSKPTGIEEVLPFVVDGTPPDIACIGATVPATSPDGAEVDVSLLVDAPDNCSTAQISCTPDSGLFPVGSTDVTCTATDEFGNVSSCTLTVEVTE